jgi:hypothetical protein
MHDYSLPDEFVRGIANRFQLATSAGRIRYEFCHAAPSGQRDPYRRVA